MRNLLASGRGGGERLSQGTHLFESAVENRVGKEKRIHLCFKCHFEWFWEGTGPLETWSHGTKSAELDGKWRIRTKFKEMSAI